MNKRILVPIVIVVLSLVAVFGVLLLNTSNTNKSVSEVEVETVKEELSLPVEEDPVLKTDITFDGSQNPSELNQIIELLSREGCYSGTVVENSVVGEVGFIQDILFINCPDYEGGRVWEYWNSGYAYLFYPVGDEIKMYKISDDDI